MAGTCSCGVGFFGWHRLLIFLLVIATIFVFAAGIGGCGGGYGYY